MHVSERLSYLFLVSIIVNNRVAPEESPVESFYARRPIHAEFIILLPLARSRFYFFFLARVGILLRL